MQLRHIYLFYPAFVTWVLIFKEAVEEDPNISLKCPHSWVSHIMSDVTLNSTFYMNFMFTTFSTKWVDLYKRINSKIILFPSCNILEIFQIFMSKVGKNSFLPCKEGGCCGPCHSWHSKGSRRVKGSIRTYNWCQPCCFSARSGKVFLFPHSCFWCPAARISQGSQSFVISKAGCGTMIVLLPEVVGWCR